MPLTEQVGERSPDRKNDANGGTADARQQHLAAGAPNRSPTDTPTASGLTRRLSSVARPDPSDQVGNGKLNLSLVHHVSTLVGTRTQHCFLLKPAKTLPVGLKR